MASFNVHEFAQRLVESLCSLTGEAYAYDRERNILEGELRHCAYISGPEGEEMYLMHEDAYASHGARVVCRPSLHHYKHDQNFTVGYSFKSHTRGCSVNTNTDTFAKALKTHGVLQSAKDAWREISTRVEDHKRGLDAQQEAKRVLGPLCVRWWERHNGDESGEFNGGSIKVTSYGSITVHIDTTDDPHFVARIIEAIKRESES